MIDKYIALTASLLIHAVVFALLAFSFSQRPAPLPASVPSAEVVEAVAVDEALVERELRKLRSTEQAQRDAETARQRKLADEADQMRRAREEEAQRLADLKQKRAQEQKEREATEVAERKRIAELKSEQERISREKAEIEKKAAAEADRLAKLEKQRKAEEEQRKKAENEKRLKAQLAAEERRLVRERQAQGNVGKAQYQADIRNAVTRNWLRPAGSTGEVNCRVLVHQLPGGEVEDVRLVQSCGNPALDRSVEAAVRKSSPLPAPPTSDLFDREIEFVFKAR